MCLLSSCPTGKFISFQGVQCVDSCGPYFFISSQGISCVDHCLSGEYLRTDQRCASQCDQGLPTVGYPLNEYINLCKCAHVVSLAGACGDSCGDNEAYDEYQHCQCQDPFIINSTSKVQCTCKYPLVSIQRFVYNDYWNWTYSECVEQSQCSSNGLRYNSTENSCSCKDGLYYYQNLTTSGGNKYSCVPECNVSGVPAYLDATQEYCTDMCQYSFVGIGLNVCV